MQTPPPPQSMCPVFPQAMQTSSPVFPLAMQTSSLSAFRQCRHPPHVPVVCLPSGMHADILLHLPSGNADILPVCLQAMQTSSLSTFRQCRHPPLVPVVCLHSGIACRRHPLSAFRKCRHHPLSTFRKCRHPPLSPSDNTDIHPYLPQTMQTPSPLSRSKRTAPLSGGNRKSRVDKDLFSPGKVTL